MGSGNKFQPGKSRSQSFPPSLKVKNKEKRQALHIQRKKVSDHARRDERFRRRREEDQDPRLREERLKRNVPLTLERKRVWDAVDRDTGDLVGVSVDVERLKRQKPDEDEEGGEDEEEEEEGGAPAFLPSEDDVKNQGNPTLDTNDEDADSMMDSASDTESPVITAKPAPNRKPSPTRLSTGAIPPQSATSRATSPTAHSSLSANLDLTPETLALRFPTLFAIPNTHTPPKLLITTSLHSTLHHEASLLTTLFPSSIYIPRSTHRHQPHRFSIREICTFASNRSYTTLLILTESQKQPAGLTLIHLPIGPTFHFTLTNWIPGHRLPGHGNPTNHHPELILNNFRTPLGLLTAHLFRSLFPPQPEIQGRQVVTLHNQRDYIFVRRHRYVFREKRPSEKSVVGPDGKDVPGVEGLRAGLQELGPRFTMKLRRIDRGIQRASGQEWVWKGGMEKERTKFQL